MATLEIGGKRVQVDDSFLKLPPEQQQATVDEIASSFASNGQSQAKAYSGSVLPFSKDAQGKVSFDSNAGILGEFKRALSLPGQVVKEAQQPKTTVSDSDVSAMSVPATMGLATVASPMSPASRTREMAPLVGSEMVKQKPPVPSAEALQQAASKGYTSARNSGVDIKPQAVTGLMGKVRSELEQDGIFDQLAPKTFSVIDKASNAPEGAVASIGNVEAIRRSLQLASRDFSNPTEQLAATRAIKGLDEWLENLSSASVVARPAATEAGMGAASAAVSAARPSAEDVAGILKNARGNYAAAQRSNSLTGALDRANTGILERSEVRAQAANSGRNLDNTIRQKVASLLEKPKEVSGFSEPEIAALNKVIEGGAGRNTARYIGNLLGGGGGIGQAGVTALGAGGGAAVGGVPGAVVGGMAPAVAGAGSKAVANALAKRSLNKVDELVRTRSPLYEEALRMADTIPSHLNKKAAIARALMMQALGDKQQ